MNIWQIYTLKILVMMMGTSIFVSQGQCCSNLLHTTCSTVSQSIMTKCILFLKIYVATSPSLRNNVNSFFHNSHKNCRIKMAVEFDQLHMATNNLTNFVKFCSVVIEQFRPWASDSQTDSSISMCPRSV